MSKSENTIRYKNPEDFDPPYLQPRHGVNYIAMTPIQYLERAKLVYPNHPSVVYGDTRKYTWEQTYSRCAQFMTALETQVTGWKIGSKVCTLCQNTPEAFEAYYSVVMAGGVLVAVNTMLNANDVAYIIAHSDSEVVITDTMFSKNVNEVFDIMKKEGTFSNIKLIIDVIDEQAIPERHAKPCGERLGKYTYEEFCDIGLVEAKKIQSVVVNEKTQLVTQCDWKRNILSEWQDIAIGYTSGTTNRPKGVVFHHRGAYINGMGMGPNIGGKQNFTYIFIVPLFHAMGWQMPFYCTMMGSKVVLIRYPSGEGIIRAVREHNGIFMGGAPVILSMMLQAASNKDFVADCDKKWPRKEGQKLCEGLGVLVGGAPPPAAILKGVTQELGMGPICHGYGLTESFGPCTTNMYPLMDVSPTVWANKTPDEAAAITSSQGQINPSQESAFLVDPETGEEIKEQGKIGEIAMRGNAMLKGYWKDEEATEKALGKGYFLTGDLAVLREYGYLVIQDRAKDIVISGGENISSIEVEGAVLKHPSVALCAVVAKPDEYWGEVPCAFVEVKPEVDVDSDDKKEKLKIDILAEAKKHLTGFKKPKDVIIVKEMPKTVTGKVKKNELRKTFKDPVEQNNKSSKL